MRLGSVRSVPVKPTIMFAKQLPRKDAVWKSGTDHSGTTEHIDRGMSQTARVSVPDMSKALGRPTSFPSLAPINPDYTPDFSRVWRPVARNLFFSKTQGRVQPRSDRPELVYANISYSQIKPKVTSPSFKTQRQRPESENSPFPLFMRNLSSWLSASSMNEKTLQMSGALETKRVKKVSSSQSGLFNASLTSSVPLTKRSEEGKASTVRIRSSSLASLN